MQMLYGGKKLHGFIYFDKGVLNNERKTRPVQYPYGTVTVKHEAQRLVGRADWPLQAVQVDDTAGY
jgi:hypothetical protein